MLALERKHSGNMISCRLRQPLLSDMTCSLVACQPDAMRVLSCRLGYVNRWSVVLDASGHDHGRASISGLLLPSTHSNPLDEGIVQWDTFPHPVQRGKYGQRWRLFIRYWEHSSGLIHGLSMSFSDWLHPFRCSQITEFTCSCGWAWLPTPTGSTRSLESPQLVRLTAQWRLYQN